MPWVSCKTHTIEINALNRSKPAGFLMDRVGFLLMKALNQSDPAIDTLSHDGGRFLWYCTASW